MFNLIVKVEYQWCKYVTDTLEFYQVMICIVYPVFIKPLRIQVDNNYIVKIMSIIYEEVYFKYKFNRPHDSWEKQNKQIKVTNDIASGAHLPIYKYMYIHSKEVKCRVIDGEGVVET